MFLSELCFIRAVDKLTVNGFIRQVLSCVVDLLVDLPQLVFCGTESFAHIGSLSFGFFRSFFQIFFCVITMFLYIGNGFCHLLQIGQLYLSGISGTLLCFYAVLQINHKLEIGFDKNKSRQIVLHGVPGSIFRRFLFRKHGLFLHCFLQLPNRSS